MRQGWSIAIIIGLLSVVTVVACGDAVVARVVPADALKVSPVRTDIVINPGESKAVKITITNPSSSDVIVRPVQNDFIAADEKGTPALMLDENTYAPKHSLKHFMIPTGDVVIPAKSTATVEQVVDVPITADPGGYFGALRFMPVASGMDAQVNLSANVASIILLRVNGDVPERLTLTDFVVQRQGAAKMFFGGGDDMSLGIRFYNDSGVQLGPIGRISVTRGDDIVYETNFNDRSRQDMILPDSARHWQVPMGHIKGFGRYAVTALFTYGSKNQSIEVTKIFWVVPVWIVVGGIAAAVVVLVGVVALVFYLRRRRRARRPRIQTGLHVR